MGDVAQQAEFSFEKQDTNFLRAIGILIVVNSHLDAYYPSASLATGGAIGNALFFALSSFGLVLSMCRRPMKFPEWCARRFLRLYPEIWVALFVYWLPIQFLTGTVQRMDTLTLLGNLFYPPWWFVQILLVLYPVAFVLGRIGRVQGVYWLFPALAALYAIFYLNFVDLTAWSVEKLPFKIVSCLLSFVFGAWLAFREKQIRFCGVRDVAALFLVTGIFFGQKIFMAEGLLLEFQFLQQWLLLPMVYYAFKASRSNFVLGGIMQTPVVAPALSWLSKRTLGLYMAHTAIARPLLRLQFAFPLNVALLLLISLGLTAVCGFLADKLQRKLEAW
jgi:hypothetical protein